MQTSLVTGLACLLGLTGAAVAAPPSPDLVHEIAPTGRLRVAINYGNPVLAQKSADEPRGVSAELARALGREIEVPVEFVIFGEAGQVTASAAAGDWDLCFLAVDPVRAKVIDFTAPYVLIEGTYLVPNGSALKAIEEVDRDGTKVGVATGSAYDLYLTRALKHATLVREENTAATYPALTSGAVTAVAGVRQPLESYAAAHPEVRVVPGRFMSIEQAMGLPHGRPEALRFVKSFVEARKADGFVAASLKASGQASATVAPPAK